MSMFSMPPELMPGLMRPNARTMNANLDEMGRDMAAMLPFGSDPEAMSRHLAASAAFAALGAGMAGHAFGVWLSAVSNTLEVAQRVSALAAGGAAPGKDAAVAPVAYAPEAAAVEPLSMPPEAGLPIAVEAPQIADAGAVAGPEAPAQAAVAASGDDQGQALANEPVVASRPAALERPDAPDDLKAIGGIGPKLEKVLNGLGIWSYAQIAGLTESEILWLDEQLGFKGRIARDGWLEQAAALAGAKV
jgi:NADH-quinone oxidoreductase subunit E